MKTLTVCDLKRLLANVSDDLPVLLSGGLDHSYMPVDRVAEEQVGSYHCIFWEMDYCEWAGPENAFSGEEPILALVLHR